MDGLESLRHVLEEQKRHAESDSVDWEAEKQCWVAANQKLIDKIAVWLRPLADSGEGLLRLEQRYFDLDEEEFGPYQVVGLHLRAPSRREVDIRASGRWVLGAQGRVDIVSGSRTATLLRRKANEWVWARRQGGELRTESFDRDSLLSVLGEMLQ